MLSKRRAPSEYIMRKENNGIIKDQAQAVGILKSYFKNVKLWKSNSTLASSENQPHLSNIARNWNQYEPFEFNY